MKHFNSLTARLLFVAVCLLVAIAPALADQYQTVATGNWSSTSTWNISTDGGFTWAATATVPGNHATDTVWILDTYTVTINQAFAISYLTIGQGSSGILKFDGVATRAVHMLGDVNILNGGQFVGRLVTQAGFDSLYIWANLNNSGTFDMYPGGGTLNNTAQTVTLFVKNGDQYVQSTGTPLLTRFGRLQFNKITRSARVIATIDVNIGQGHAVIPGNPLGTTQNVQASLFLSGTRTGVNEFGTWEQNAGTFRCFTTTISPSAAGGFNLTGSASIYDSTGAFFFGCPTTVNTTGTLTFNEGNRTFGFEDTCTVTAGTFNIYGQLEVTQFGSTLTNVTITGGTFNVYAQGGLWETMDSSANATSSTGGHVIYLGPGSGSTPNVKMNFTGGTFTIVNPIKYPTNQRELYLGTAAVFNLSGATFNIGDGSNTATGYMGFQIYDSAGTHSFNNLVVQGGSGQPGRRTVLEKPTGVGGTLTVASGSALYDSTFTLTVTGNVANSGTITDGSGAEVKLSAGTGAHTLSGNGSYTNLELNDANGASLTGSTTTVDSLTLTTGTLTVGSNSLTLHKKIGGTPTNLSAGSSSSLTYSGSGSGMVVPSSVSTLNNLTLNNSNGLSLNGALQVNGTTTVTLGQVNTGANTLTLGPSGSLSEAGSGNIVVGTVQVTRTPGTLASRIRGLRTPASYENFGNIGFSIDPASGASPGVTTVTRKNLAQGPSPISIERYYDVNPTVNSGLNASVIFKYDSTATELNGNADGGLGLWRSTDAGGTWSTVGGTLDTVQKTLTATGVTHLSRWTASTTSLLPNTNQNSDVVAGSLAIPGTISSNVTSQANEVSVYSFKVRDGGASASDNDAVGTIISSLQIEQGSANNATNWTQYIQGADLYSGVTLIGTGTVGASTISWSGSPFDSVPNNTTKEYTLKVWLKSSLPVGADNKVLEFKVNQNADFTVSVYGSFMAPGGSDVVGAPGTGVAVVAARLNFVGSIANTTSGTTFAASVSASDTNGNIDADFVNNVTLAVGSGSGVLSGTNPKPGVSGTASFTNLAIAGHGAVTLNATSGLLTMATSNSFTVDSAATFKVSAGGPNDTLYWNSPSTWTTVLGYSSAGYPRITDHVILDNTYQTGSYAVKIGVTAAAAQASDSAATIYIGYPGNTNTISLLIPAEHNQYFPGALYWGDGVAGNFDMVIDAGGLFQVSSGVVGHNAFNYPAVSANDSLKIRAGGKLLFNSASFGSGIFGMTSARDGDYGTVEYDVPSGFSDANGQQYWYPNLVFSNTHGAPTYYVYSGGSGAMYVKGNLTVNAGARDSLGLTPDQPTIVYGNVVNNGVLKFYGGPLMMAGSSVQTISGSPITDNGGLIMMNNAGVNLQSNFYETGGTVQTTGNYTYVVVGTTDSTVTTGGVLNTGTDTLFLTPSGTMSEGSNPVQGNVSSTRTLSQNSNSDFGHGFQLDALGGTPGVTTVFRKTGVADSGYAHNKSILRHYDVSAANNSGLNATMVFGYSSSPTELNGIAENTLLLEKSTNGGTSWAGKTGVVSTVLHNITATSISSPNARWTASATASPLFVPHTITIRKFKDTTGTVAPQVVQKWRLSLYQDSVTAGTLLNSGFFNSGQLVTGNLQSGTYIAAENDSIGWLHLGRIRHGTSVGNSTIPGSSRFDTIVVTDLNVNSFDTTDFVNQPVSYFSILKLRDLDGNLSTTGDQTPKKWHLSLYHGSVAPANLVAVGDTSYLQVTNLQAGTYIAVEADSTPTWIRLNGNRSRFDTVTIVANAAVVDTFINLKGNAMLVRKYEDTDGNLATTADRIPKVWHFVVRKDSANGAVVAAYDSSSFGLLNLGDGTYFVSEADSAGWIHLGSGAFGVANPTSANSISFGLSNGGNADVIFVNAPPVYSQLYRSFRADSIALSVDNKDKPGKPVDPKKADKDDFSFTLVAPKTSALTLTFQNACDGSLDTGSTHDTSWTNTKTFTTSAVDSGTTVTVRGRAYKGSLQKASYSWATSPKKTTGKATVTNQLLLPMPNRINVLSDTYVDSFTAATGMLVGRDRTVDSSKYLGWVMMKTYKDAYGSLIDKNGQHTCEAKGFDFFTTGCVPTTKPIEKKQGKLPPGKQNNVLFANMVATKMSIVASEAGITPAGFGELIYDDHTSNPLNGMMVKDIVALADTLMGGHTRVDTTHPKPTKTVLTVVRLFADSATYANISNVLYRIDSVFEGPMDTTSFASSLVVKGARTLSGVPFLRANPNMTPSKIVAQKVYDPMMETPVQYQLFQNYPNPFNPTTTIRFGVPVQAVVTLKIYNILGQEVTTLLDRQQFDAGVQEVQFNAGNLASGVYFYRMIADGFNDDGVRTSFVTVKKMMLLK